MQFYLPLQESKQKPAARALTSEGTDDARDEEWMKRAMELAERAKEGGEIPVGAVVVLGDDLVGEGCNMIRASVDPSGHAEMIAIRQAAQRLGNYRLTQCTLYVTLEPCCMCAGAIILARMKRVVFGARDVKTGCAGSALDLIGLPKFNHVARVKAGVMEDACSKQ
ncbi:hypothetical protein GUITHDRAFT_75445 [Guillardia theta CCMP2712]|uniref:tRNA-specific adenosine deaminase 2 n=1 Tax=Guillardia theta (strain CCMP2712) TaxID=905079 RepID=L1IWE5_GUITC|nr:hypothetical protein GUITHDRAFT_75445 [Guillardia theta CCMP2712]EKX40588.1 hypothetical protein GUITHDRAFT_75445 [Guillardia theta CCMP2712]|eukprot:XP_005827568.1 hypothetical protein GUITHDRAFT_75445 [Guillardia theta CCMP2712]